MQIYSREVTNHLFPLTIPAVNHLMLTDFEGFPVSHNCSDKTIEDKEISRSASIYRGVLEVRTFLLFTEELKKNRSV